MLIKTSEYILKLGGTTPEESELVKIISKNGASSVAQFTNYDDGKPSGPAAEVGESSCIASIIFFSDNTISVKYKSVVFDIDGGMEKRRGVSYNLFRMWLCKKRY